ncbi:hypothetical protein AACH06_29305 [Ideonella sp. DXS29W]|uniref:Uncharacterized protein n=1 Tax=Ideonella lacteola TaxID=2984193 RepID=A0ABU9C2M3_9BURK
MDTTTQGAVPFKLDVDAGRLATPASIPGATYADMTGLQRSGVRLATWLLAMMAVLALVLLSMVAFNEYVAQPPEVATAQMLIERAAHRYAEAGHPETLKQANELLVHLAQVKRSSRDFWLGYSQFLLMNLLLPVLTSILGYVFGTARGSGGS